MSALDDLGYELEDFDHNYKREAKMELLIVSVPAGTYSKKAHKKFWKIPAVIGEEEKDLYCWDELVANVLVGGQKYECEVKDPEGKYPQIMKAERIKGTAEEEELLKKNQEALSQATATTIGADGKVERIKTEIVYPPSTIKATTDQPIVQMQATHEQALAVWKEFESFKVKVLDPTDFGYFVQELNDKGNPKQGTRPAYFVKKECAEKAAEKGNFDIKPRVKKSGCRKVATAFNLHDEIIMEEIIPKPPLPTLYARYTVRITAPNGRSSIGIGVCSANERGFSKADHDIPATAHTRAKNRGILDMVGFGEVSSEEIAANKGEE